MNPFEPNLSYPRRRPRRAADAVRPRRSQADHDAGHDVHAQGRRRRPVLPVHAQRRLEPGRGHRQDRQLLASTRASACAPCRGEKTAFAYSDDISEAALLDAARRHAHDRARPGSRHASRSPPARQRGRRPRAVPAASTRSPRSTATAKVELLERVEKMARAKDPRVVQVMAGLAGEYDVVLVARSDGALAADVRPLVRLSVTVIAEQNGRREMGSARRRRPLRLRLFRRRRMLREVRRRSGATRRWSTSKRARRRPAR